MNHPQTAITPDHCKAGIFIEADILANRQNDIKTACRESLKALKTLQDKYPEDSLGMTVASAATPGAAFGHSGEGSEIKPFRPLGGGLAPATQHDILHPYPVHAPRHRVCLVAILFWPHSAAASVSPAKSTVSACCKNAAWTVSSTARKIRMATIKSAMSPLFPKAGPMRAAATSCCKNTAMT